MDRATEHRGVHHTPHAASSPALPPGEEAALVHGFSPPACTAGAPAKPTPGCRAAHGSPRRGDLGRAALPRLPRTFPGTPVPARPASGRGILWVAPKPAVPPLRCSTTATRPPHPQLATVQPYTDVGSLGAALRQTSTPRTPAHQRPLDTLWVGPEPPRRSLHRSMRLTTCNEPAAPAAAGSCDSMSLKLDRRIALSTFGNACWSKC